MKLPPSYCLVLRRSLLHFLVTVLGHTSVLLQRSTLNESTVWSLSIYLYLVLQHHIAPELTCSQQTGSLSFPHVFAPPVIYMMHLSLHQFIICQLCLKSAARSSGQKKSELPDDEFLKWMTSIGGTPSEILTNKDILQLFVPVLKADLRLLELIRYEKPQMKLFSCSISSFDGKQDVPHDLEAWKDLTRGEFTIIKLSGGHFYLKEPDNEKFLIDHITKHLETAEVDYL
ncbi:S-acyl fatty acid synthase thioesterase, medium chain isoform X5 [Mobula birostris]